MAQTAFSIPFTNYLKDAFVSCLRAAYGSEESFPDYRYNQQETLTKLSIYKAFARRSFKSPAIVVIAGSGDFSFTVLGTEEQMTNTELDLSEPKDKYKGAYTLDIELKIYAESTTDREKLTDLTAFYARHLFRNAFQTKGIAFKSLRVSGESHEDWDEKILHTNSIVISCYQEYTAEPAVTLVDIIEKIPVTAVPYS